MKMMKQLLLVLFFGLTLTFNGVAQGQDFSQDRKPRERQKERDKSDKKDKDRRDDRRGDDKDKKDKRKKPD
jgi:hypothetical protein